MSDLKGYTEVTVIIGEYTHRVVVSFDEYDSICAKAESGGGSWHGEDKWGNSCMINLKDVVAIYQISSESREREVEDEKAESKLRESFI